VNNLEKSHRMAATIHLNHLKHNYRSLRAYIPPGCLVLAVIKADAYGHGAVMTAKALEQEGIGYFAVATPDEAFELRDAGIQTPILILGRSDPGCIGQLAREHITQCVYSKEYADELSSHLQGGKIKIHIKVDTGMSRLGFGAQETDSIAEVCQNSCFEPEGIFTHFSSADGEDDSCFKMQQDLFYKTVETLSRKGITFRHRHASNSAGSFRAENAGLTMVRLGIMLYGAWPSEYIKKMFGDKIQLKPVMTLSATVAQIRQVPAHTGISYDRTYITKKSMKIAVVTAGYADGIPRLWSNQGHVVIKGERCPIVGRVCMDMLMVDISHHQQEVCVGDRVILFGEGGVDATEAAGWADSISYELFCRVSPRVPRLY
jgi:alanine racemase